LRRFGKGLRQALQEGMNAPPVQRPKPVKVVRAGKEKLRRLNRLKEWRMSLGENLSLDPSLLWPLTSLERLAAAPESLGAELASDEVRHWQRDAIAPSLRSCLKSLQ
jgi:ribonuclease D